MHQESPERALLLHLENRRPSTAQAPRDALDVRPDVAVRRALTRALEA